MEADKEKIQYVIAIAMALDIPKQLATLIGCQSAFETENFTSHAFIQGNNGFGYKHVEGAKLQITPKVHSTESDMYAAYESFDTSIKEICLWIFRRQKETKFPHDLVMVQTAQQYAALLKGCGYYGGKESDYADGINEYLKQL